eukprot:1386384-Rhodomonas_salina.1
MRFAFTPKSRYPAHVAGHVTVTHRVTLWPRAGSHCGHGAVTHWVTIRSRATSRYGRALGHLMVALPGHVTWSRYRATLWSRYRVTLPGHVTGSRYRVTLPGHVGAVPMREEERTSTEPSSTSASSMSSTYPPESVPHVTPVPNWPPQSVPRARCETKGLRFWAGHVVAWSH